MNRSKAVIAVACLVLVAGCATQRTARTIAYSNFHDGDYADTIAWIRNAESRGNVTPEIRAELTYLEARSLEEMGEYDRSDALYSYLKEQHPKSRFAYLAMGKSRKNRE